MDGIKAFAYICLGVFSIAFIYATISDPTLATFFSILVHPEQWAFVVATDLTIGLCFFILFIYAIEGDLTKTVFWALPMLVFGNGVSAVYLIVNLSKVRARLNPAG